MLKAGNIFCIELLSTWDALLKEAKKLSEDLNVDSAPEDTEEEVTRLLEDTEEEVTRLPEDKEEEEVTESEDAEEMLPGNTEEALKKLM